ncbi:capsular polysaccharide biosynthesis protein [Polycladidibacter stylochi]|uniref:capsular polysaccharide biosynthesis protein n=1 Tax=Polycladidibacter stylochi TaxID=1807766 RepID=UPI00138F3BDF|nr:capsular polysaccharide biosynthesis protein [Pseudovibrio stylochi]
MVLLQNSLKYLCFLTHYLIVVVEGVWSNFRYLGNSRNFTFSIRLPERNYLIGSLWEQEVQFIIPLFVLKRACFFGWGRKKSGQRAIRFARMMGGRFVLLEDSFLSSVDRNGKKISVVVDHEGIYYDSSQTCTLDKLLEKKLTKNEVSCAQEIITTWRYLNLSKYNSLEEYKGPLPERYVLVIDQVRGDLSIKYGDADVSSFHRMLDKALWENPDCQVVLKVHPDIFSNSAKGHFNLEKLSLNPRITIIADSCHVVRLIKECEKVYTVTSQVGFEALIWGKPVRCFGMPFYAGRGLSEDQLKAPSGRDKCTLEELVFRAFVSYTRYVSPITNKECDFFEAANFIALQRRNRLMIAGDVVAIGFSKWKKRFISDYLAGSPVKYINNNENLDQQKNNIAVWGSKYQELNESGSKLLRIEDGFLRSSGLGADLIRPFSLVIDDMGIYYDATRPSRLEKILNESQYKTEQLDRAHHLRNKIIQMGLTKYNVGAGSWQRPDGSKKVLLVVGQVESDASLKYGSPEIKNNLIFLKTVREQNPDAYVLYKPHPDVVAGLRDEGKGEVEAKNFCDEIILETSSHELLNVIDELHTMTSLMGFEALMRGVKVVCYGLPFYSGWGITEDKVKNERRSRTLTVDDLVYGSLIDYPRYVGNSKYFLSPEEAIEELYQQIKANKRNPNGVRFIKRKIIQSWKRWH